MKHYYEIGFDHNTRARKIDGDVVGDYSICIIGEREPSYEEAEEFCKADMKQMGYEYVVYVREGFVKQWKLKRKITKRFLTN